MVQPVPAGTQRLLAKRRKELLASDISLLRNAVRPGGQGQSEENGKTMKRKKRPETEERVGSGEKERVAGGKVPKCPAEKRRTGEAGGPYPRLRGERPPAAQDQPNPTAPSAGRGFAEPAPRARVTNKFPYRSSPRV